MKLERVGEASRGVAQQRDVGSTCGISKGYLRRRCYGGSRIKGTGEDAEAGAKLVEN